jgi:elongation factor G
VWIEIEPNPGSGVSFETRVVGGSVPRQFWAGIEKGVRDVAEKGPLAGYPVIDFKATLYDGSFHTVDSDELSFRLAGQLATRKGIEDSSPVLLEPIMDVEVTVPDEAVGAVNGDLNSRRGRLQGMEPKGGMTTIKAEVPMSEVLTYSQSLTSLTGGRGDYHMAFARYEEVPAHIAQKVIAETKKEQEEATV